MGNGFIPVTTGGGSSLVMTDEKCWVCNGNGRMVEYLYRMEVPLDSDKSEEDEQIWEIIENAENSKNNN